MCVCVCTCAGVHLCGVGAHWSDTVCVSSGGGGEKAAEWLQETACATTGEDPVTVTEGETLRNCV